MFILMMEKNDDSQILKQYGALQAEFEAMGGYALDYEVEDMQNYVLNGGSEEYLTYSRDVMSVLTDIRKQWGMIYPFE